MKRKRLFGILAAAISIGIFSGGAYAEEEVVFGTTDGFEAEAEVPENATFAKVAWMDNEIYGYSPSELYDPISGVMPVFFCQRADGVAASAGVATIVGVTNIRRFVVSSTSLL